MDDEPLVLVGDPQAAARAAERLFVATRVSLAPLLPPSALIEHIGATAVPGCETKGDLDIVIRVAAADFPRCAAILAERYRVNSGSIRTETFAAFTADDGALPLGIQLVVLHSELDDFSRFRDRLRADPSLVRRYNALKRAYDGKRSEEYRAAKGAFVDAVLAGRL